MRKKDKPEILWVPCHINGCDFTTAIDFSVWDYQDDDKQEEYKRRQMKSVIQQLIDGHARGKHVTPHCCCHHSCSCPTQSH